MDTIKFLLSIAAVTDAEIVLLDVDEAFLTTRVNKVRKQRSKRDPPPPGRWPAEEAPTRVCRLGTVSRSGRWPRAGHPATA